MKCPKCLQPLIYGNPEVYETLAEHVIDVNGERYAKPTMRCPKSCYGRRAFWDLNGDAYGYFAWYAKILHFFNLWKYGYIRFPNAAESDAEEWDKMEKERHKRWKEESDRLNEIDRKHSYRCPQCGKNICNC